MIEFLKLLIFPGILFWIFLSFAFEWIDRKLTARLQKRVGPFFAGPSGFFQPLADFIKLLSKEDITPKKSEGFIFELIPILILFIPLFSLTFIPFFEPFLSFNGDILLLLYLPIIQTLLIQNLGFSSSSKFGLVGIGRGITQALSFEIAMMLAGITPILFTGSFRLVEIMNSGWLISYLPLSFFVFLVSLLGESQFLPFDVPHAKQEIVAGWKTELSGKKLAMVKLGKNLQFLFLCSLIVCLFLNGGNLIELIIKLILIVVVVSIVKAMFARLRIDQIVNLTWKYLIPLALLQMFLISILR